MATSESKTVYQFDDDSLLKFAQAIASAVASTYLKKSELEDALAELGITSTPSTDGDSAGSTSGGEGGGYISPTYDVVIVTPVNGTVAVTPTSPMAKDIVTITPKANTDHILSRITATSSDGVSVTLTKKPDGSYTFVQPSKPVSIEAIFEPNGIWDVG